MCEQIVCIEYLCWFIMADRLLYIHIHINSISQSESQTEVCKPAMRDTHTHTRLLFRPGLKLVNITTAGLLIENREHPTAHIPH